ncbi:Carboxylesterase family domain-containing protein [Trichoderma compactum]
MIKSLLLVYLLGGACALGAPSHSTSENPVVDLGYARYRGVSNATYGLDYYFGIRYAVPPEGDLRWRAPLDIESHGKHSTSAVVDATTVGPQCVQGPTAWANGTNLGALQVLGAAPQLPSSEDCLLLNVLTPTSPKSKSLPVVVYIPGGGYVTGNSISSDGSQFTQYAQGNVVWVSIQYRLGAYGFLNPKEFDGHDAVKNTGLLDQRLALEWVQRHISAFGGNPSKVTIWGGSAGGGSVVNQMIYKGGEKSPPYRGAIAEFPWLQPYHDDVFLQKQYQAVLNDAKCGNLACLRNLSPSALETAITKSYYTAYDAGLYACGDMFFGPSVDGNFVHDLPTYYEQPFFRSLIFPLIALLAPLSIPGSDPSLWQAQQINGNANINCPTHYFAAAAEKYGVPAYKSIFDAGVYVHSAADFPIFNAQIFTVDTSVATSVKDYFLSFIMGLDPNTFPSVSHQTRTHWPQYGQKNYAILNVQETSITVQRDPDASDRCDFFILRAPL